MSRLVELQLNPSPRVLRQFGVLAFLVFGLGSLALYGGVVTLGSWPSEHREVAAVALAVLAAVSGLASLSRPSANRPLFVALTVLAFPIGFVLSHVLLASLFFGLIVPIALAMRVTGRDVLRRRQGRRAESYWVKARPARPVQDYFRQF